MKGRAGQRVYWKGVFPDASKQGKIVRTGSIRHEILWDGMTEAELISVNFLGPVSELPK